MNPALKKLIFALLIIVIVGELVWAYQTVSGKPITSNKKTPTVVTNVPKKTTIAIPTDAAKLSLLPAKIAFKAGQVSNIDIILDVGSKKVSSVDIDLKYDPNLITISKITPVTKNFNKVLTNKIDIKTSRAILSLTQTQGSVPVTGKIVIGSINIQAVKTGTSDLSFNYKGYGETNDSNVLEIGKTNDILGFVEKAVLTVTP